MVKVEPGSERKNIVPICSNDIQWLVQRFASGQLMINPIIGFESVIISPGAGQIILTNLRYKPHINKRVLAGHERSPPWTKSFSTPRGSCRSDVFDPKDRQMQRPRVPNGRTK